MEWIEIPNLIDGPFSMSSLILGQRAEAASRLARATASVSPLEVNAGHRFERAQPLRLLTYIYNAERSAAPPDVMLKIQVFLGEKQVIATPLSRLKTEGIEDLSRIPYLAELNTEGMPGGSYILQVTAFDRTARTNASQRASFEIE
jgi:hypothetical protein